jgi:glycine dehydrogenase subunit 2
VPSNSRGGIDLDALRGALGPDTAALMITNPSTLGIFEDQIDEVLAAVRDAGAVAYMDGANLNAILGRFRAGEAGFDIMHFNLHKTFSTPHGGGGPGAGPIGVSARLAPFLPAPLPRLVAGDPDAVRLNAWAGRSTPGAQFELEAMAARPTAVGRVRTFGGNFGMHVRAYAYIRSNGADGLRQVTDDAVLAANYLRVRLRDAYELPYDRICKHEAVFSARRLKRDHGVSALDVAKAILDEGIHPPTIYFPLIVEEALMIEPTETETLETLDRFVSVMRGIAERAAEDPAALREAPRTTPVGRLDEATAARQPDLAWSFSTPDRTVAGADG